MDASLDIWPTSSFQNLPDKQKGLMLAVISHTQCFYQTP